MQYARSPAKPHELWRRSELSWIGYAVMLPLDLCCGLVYVYVIWYVKWPPTEPVGHWRLLHVLRGIFRLICMYRPGEYLLVWIWECAIWICDKAVDGDLSNLEPSCQTSCYDIDAWRISIFCVHWLFLFILYWRRDIPIYIEDIFSAFFFGNTMSVRLYLLFISFLTMLSSALTYI